MTRRTKALSACILGLCALLFVAEYLLRQAIWNRNVSNPAVWNLILYTAPISREPGREIAFRFYGINGQERFRADIPLNNLGFFSRRPYSIQRDPGEFRIVVIGGEQTASSVVNVSWPDLLEDELNRLDPSRPYRVFNIGWPDAGPEQYIKYWKEHGRRLAPDLVIVNYLESDFYRAAPSGVTGMFRGKPVSYSRIEYRVGAEADDVARTQVPHVAGRPVSSFRDPNAVPNRPYGFFVSPAVADAPDKIRLLQRRIVRDFLEPAMPPFGALLAAAIANGGRPPELDIAAIRNLDPVSSQPTEVDRLVDYGVKYFGWMARNIPNLILIHNFNFAERFTEYPFTTEMVRRDPAIQVLDMRTRIPEGITDREFESWYMVPEMPEKWSTAGHRAYAAIVAPEVLERTGARPTAGTRK